MTKPDNPNAPPPKRGALLDYDGLRAATAAAIKDARVTQAETAELVAERVPERNRAPTVSAVSNAVRQSGAAVATLQTDILRALTGATLTGPLFRVD